MNEKRRYEISLYIKQKQKDEFQRKTFDIYCTHEEANVLGKYLEQLVQNTLNFMDSPCFISDLCLSYAPLSQTIEVEETAQKKYICYGAWTRDPKGEIFIENEKGSRFKSRLALPDGGWQWLEIQVVADPNKVKFGKIGEVSEMHVRILDNVGSCYFEF